MKREEAATVLGIELPASPGQIEAGFRRVVHAAHPDRGGDAETFRRAVTARDLLAGTHGRSDRGSGVRSPVVITTRRARWQIVASRRRRRLAQRFGWRPPRVR